MLGRECMHGDSVAMWPFNVFRKLHKRIEHMSKAIEDLTLSVSALEAAAIENAAEIAALKAAAVPPVVTDDSAELAALKTRVDAVTAAIAPAKPAPVV
jgi:hypothetical protein